MGRGRSAGGWLRAVGLVLLLACGGSEGGSEWVSVTAEDGTFSFRMPGEATRTTRHLTTPVGPVPVQVHMYQTAEESFMVNYTDYPPEVLGELSVEELLDGARDGAIASSAGMLLEHRSIDLEGVPGRAVRISAAGGEVEVQGRFFVVDTRLYQILATTSTEDATSPRVASFLDSFVLHRGGGLM